MRQKNLRTNLKRLQPRFLIYKKWCVARITLL